MSKRVLVGQKPVGACRLGLSEGDHTCLHGQLALATGASYSRISR